MVPHHPQHETANRWLVGHGDATWGTCLFTQSAFLRLSMNPKVLNSPVSAVDAIAILKRLTDMPNHAFLDVSPRLTDTRFVELWPRITGYRQVTDATILQVAAANNASVASFDKGLHSILPEGVSLDVLYSS